MYKNYSEEQKMTFVENLTRAVGEWRLSQTISGRSFTNKTLARAMQVPEMSLSNWLKGRIPSPENLKIVCDFFNLPEDTILDAAHLTLKVKYLRSIDPIGKVALGDWIDLKAGESITILPEQYTAIPLGVAMELPRGYEAIIAPRSSLFKTHGLICANSIGVVDESYCGDNDEWHFLVYATKLAQIKKGERICQFRIIKHQPIFKIETVESLGNADRGGIGSTGR